MNKVIIIMYKRRMAYPRFLRRQRLRQRFSTRILLESVIPRNRSEEWRERE